MQVKRPNLKEKSSEANALLRDAKKAQKPLFKWTSSTKKQQVNIGGERYKGELKGVIKQVDKRNAPWYYNPKNWIGPIMFGTVLSCSVIMLMGVGARPYQNQKAPDSLFSQAKGYWVAGLGAGIDIVAGEEKKEVGFFASKSDELLGVEEEVTVESLDDSIREELNKMLIASENLEKTEQSMLGFARDGAGLPFNGGWEASAKEAAGALSMKERKANENKGSLADPKTFKEAITKASLNGATAQQLLAQWGWEMNKKSERLAKIARILDTSAADGNFEAVLPAAGKESSKFGFRRDPFTKRAKMHSGFDIAATEGTPIRAASSGVVVRSGFHREYGNMVDIVHGKNFASRYGHASRLFVQEGDWVEAGEIIGEVGSTGRSTGPHLHFEARRNGKALNPESFLASGKVSQVREITENEELERLANEALAKAMSGNVPRENLSKEEEIKKEPVAKKAAESKPEQKKEVAIKKEQKKAPVAVKKQEVAPKKEKAKEVVKEEEEKKPVLVVRPETKVESKESVNVAKPAVEKKAEEVEEDAIARKVREFEERMERERFQRAVP